MSIDVDKIVSEEREKSERRDYKKREKVLLGEVKKLQEIVRTHEVLSAAKSLPSIRINKSKGKTQGTVLTGLSDVHVEHYIDPKTVNGINKYLPEIANARLRVYFEKILRLTDILRHDLVIDNLCFAILGDLIHGHIHDEYIASNKMYPVEASLYVFELIKNGIDFLLEHGKFKRIDVPCHVGNHSRISQKIFGDAEAKMSHEFSIYQHLARLYEGNDVINFHISESYFSYQEIYGKLIRFHHGHAFRYLGGIGGLYVPLMRFILKSNQQRRADLDFMGHWHSIIHIPEALVNGSVCGFDTYALKLAFKPEPPMQQFQVIDSKRGFTYNVPIYLE